MKNSNTSEQSIVQLTYAPIKSFYLSYLEQLDKKQIETCVLVRLSENPLEIFSVQINRRIFLHRLLCPPPAWRHSQPRLPEKRVRPADSRLGPFRGGHVSVGQPGTTLQNLVHLRVSHCYNSQEAIRGRLHG